MPRGRRHRSWVAPPFFLWFSQSAPIVSRIERCAATNVDPGTARRDLTIPQSLLRLYDRPDRGVYLTVVKGGEMSVNNRIGPA